MATGRREKGTGSWDTVTKKGIEYQRYRKTYNGRVKEFTGRTKKCVKEKVKAYEDSPSSGATVNQDYMTTTVYEYSKEWLKKTKLGVVNHTYYDTLEDTLEYYIKGTDLGESYLQNIIDTQPFHDHYIMLARKYSVSTIKKTHSFLCMVFTYANKHQHTTVSPRGVKLPIEDNVASKKKVVEILNDEFMYLMANEPLRQNTNINRINGAIGTPVYKSSNAWIVVLILFSGMRTGEIYNLDINSDINLDKGMITIQDQTTRIKERNTNGEPTGRRVEYVHAPKTGRGKRIFPLNPYSKLAVEKLLEEAKLSGSNRLCVTHNGKNPSASSVTRTMKAMLTRISAPVDIPHFGLHDARHSYASFLLRHGVRDDIVAKWMGHDVITTKKTYSHIVSEEEIEALNVFAPIGATLSQDNIPDLSPVPSLENIFNVKKSLE